MIYHPCVECAVRNEPVRHRNQQLAPIDPIDHQTIRWSKKDETVDGFSGGTRRRRGSHPVSAIDFPTPTPVPGKV
jgi:hypothetical protein